MPDHPQVRLTKEREKEIRGWAQGSNAAHTELLAEIDSLRSARQPAPTLDCVTRWRKHAAEKPAWKVDDLYGNSNAAYDAERCLEWLATAPTPAVVVTSAYGDVEIVRVWKDPDVRMLNPPRSSVEAGLHDALVRAAILDRSELVAWLRSRCQLNVDMPPALRALLDKEP